MKPKIVLFDLEIIPDLPKALESWCKLSSFPGKTLKANVTTIVCAGWKEFNEKRTHCVAAWDFKDRWKENVNDDYEVCKKIREVLADADAVVTQNGIRFDWKHLQTRLIANGLDPLPKIKHIDTRKLCSQNLYLIDNKLDTMGKFLSGNRKMEHEGWDLWVDTHNRKKKACNTMKAYCIQDVNLLEDCFRALKKFAKVMPNHNLWKNAKQFKDGKILCPFCGSEEIKKNGWHHTTTRTYQRIFCKSCRAYSRLDAKDANPRGFN